MHMGFVGDKSHRIGNGKTLAAVKKIHELHTASNYKVYSNIKLYFPHVLIGPQELIKISKDKKSLHHSIFFIDEIQNLFNSLGKGTANLVMAYIIYQRRKGDTHIFWTSQRVKNVDNRIVDDATIMHCSKWHKGGSQCHDTEDICKQDHIIKVVNIFSKRGYGFQVGDYITSLYDTAEVVPLAFFHHQNIRKELQEIEPNGHGSGPEITNNAPGNDTEIEYIKQIQRILGKKAIIRHNAQHNDGRISLYDVEVEHHGKLYLFDVVGKSGDPPRLNTKHKNWGDKIELARERNAEGWLVFRNGKGWRGLKIDRQAEWVNLKSKVTLTEKRMKSAIDINAIFT